MISGLMFNIESVGVLLICITCIFLGLVVYLKDPKKSVNKFFLGFALFSCMIVGSAHLSDLFLNINEWTTLLLSRVTFGSVVGMCVTLYFFSLIYPFSIKIPRYLSILNVIIWICSATLFALAVFTPFFASGIKRTQWGFDVVSSNAYYQIFLPFAVVLLITSLIIFARNYLKSRDLMRIQLRYLLLGFGIFVVLEVLFNTAVPVILNNQSLYRIGNYAVIFFVGFTAYGIIKTGLFNIKVIATETTVILLSFGLIVEVFLSSSINEEILKGIIWMLATYGGWQLIKSVKKEIEQRKKIEKLAKELETANEHLKEVDKLKDDFLSMASHELNTPIAAIKGYLSMILVEGMGGKIPDKARAYLDTVFTSAGRLANMVKDLLNVSRIESGRIHIIWEQKPIEDMINQAITEVMSKAREAGHTLTYEASKTKMPATWFDATRITEILINMIGNSIKYTPNGGKIVVRAVHDEDKIVVSVEDNGKGIPNDRQKAVFEKFTQVDVLKDEVKGTGLGMYISKKFIELHKGKIWFHSDGENKGTTFFFSLPILKEKPADPHEGEEAVLH